MIVIMLFFTLQFTLDNEYNLLGKENQTKYHIDKSNHL